MAIRLHRARHGFEPCHRNGPETILPWGGTRCGIRFNPLATPEASPQSFCLVFQEGIPDFQGIEIKRTLAPKLNPAFRESMSTLGADRGTYLLPGGERFALSEQVTAINLIDFLSEMGTS